MISVRDICAVAFVVLLVAAVIGTGYVLRERPLSPRDITDLSSSHHRGNW
ncbi:MAG: hypothetical protein J0I29_12030 [Rhizobiales bacterium]|nr:hypothetical protein [Hyphomicrobiales bacterium]